VPGIDRTPWSGSRVQIRTYDLALVGALVVFLGALGHHEASGRLHGHVFRGERTFLSRPLARLRRPSIGYAGLTRLSSSTWTTYARRPSSSGR